MKYLTLLLLPLLFVSCKPREIITVEYRERVEYRDTTITIKLPGDTVTEIVKLPPDKIMIEPHVLETEFCRSVAWVKESELLHDLEQKPVEKDTIMQVKETTVTETITLPPVEVNVLKWWQVFFMRLGQVSLAAGMGTVAWKLWRG